MSVADSHGMIEAAKTEGREEGLREGRLEGCLEGRLKGRLEGLEEGNHKARVEIARTMLEKGISMEQVAQVTSISKEELTTPSEPKFHIDDLAHRL